LIDYRIKIKKPLKTNAGLDGLIKSIKETAEYHNKTFSEIQQIMSENEWQSVKPDYIKTVELKKGTVDAMTDFDKRILKIRIEKNKQNELKQLGANNG
jgi:hypothetical protein